jgi:hypothetical protein
MQVGWTQNWLPGCREGAFSWQTGLGPTRDILMEGPASQELH